MDSNPIDITLLCNQIETRLNHRPGHLIIKLITTKSYLTYLLILPGLLAMLTSDSCIQTYLSPPPCCCMPTCCLIPAITSQAFILNIPTFGTSSSSSTYSWHSPWLPHTDKKALMESNTGVWCGTVVIHHRSYQWLGQGQQWHNNIVTPTCDDRSTQQHRQLHNNRENMAMEQCRGGPSQENERRPASIEYFITSLNTAFVHWNKETERQPMPSLSPT